MIDSTGIGKNNPIKIQQSECNYKIQHYRAEIEFDFEKSEIHGCSTIIINPSISIRELRLHAINLRIESVIFSDSKEGLEYKTESQFLVITFPNQIKQGQEFKLRIIYNATPKGGMYFQLSHTDPESYYVFTCGEGGLHPNWLPIYSGLLNKFTTEMLLTIPERYVAISNGVLIEKTKEKDNFTTWHWLQGNLHSNYLMAFYVGDFEKGELQNLGDIALDYWVPRGKLKEGAYTFAKTKDMMAYFAEILNYPYPWGQYTQVAIPDYCTIGALEHTGVTGHNASVLRLETDALEYAPPIFSEYHTDWTMDVTISHELSHHWFGNNLTCWDLGHIWLHESFASYMMMLWTEHSQGREQFAFDVAFARDHYFKSVALEKPARPLAYHDYECTFDVYDLNYAYMKGAVILHMLRSVLGDEAFFNSLSYFLHKNEFSNVSTRNFQEAIEESSGRRIGWFFQQWIDGGGHPRLVINYRYLPERNIVDITIKQVQPSIDGQGIFRLPVVITIVTPKQTIVKKSTIVNSDERLFFHCHEKPLMVSIDGDGDLVAEIHHEKEKGELAYQARYDGITGRLRAIRQLVSRFPYSGETYTVLEKCLNGEGFWGLQAESAFLLGEIASPKSAELIDLALRSSEYRVRKAAAIALGRFDSSISVERLVEIIKNDPQSDVVGTALAALGHVMTETHIDFVEAQLERDSHYDRIRIGALCAIKELGDKGDRAIVRPFAEGLYNQRLREAALLAWEAIDPGDQDLHDLLVKMVAMPPYFLQILAIEMLGRLAVNHSIPVLEKLISQGADSNLIVAAQSALKEIRLIFGFQNDT